MESDPITVETARQMVERHEGYSEFPKQDSGGTVQVGFGTNLTRRGLSRPEADWLVIRDCIRLARDMSNYPFWALLNTARRAALIDMAYDLGLEGFAKFGNMIGRLGAGDYDGAANELMRTNWATEFLTRAAELAHVIRVGSVQIHV